MAQHKTNRHYKTFYFLIFYTGLISMTAYAQQAGKATITGAIADAEGKPLSNVPVTLLKLKDSSLVKGVISNAEGKYEFNQISPGSYFINASLLGYKKYFRDGFYN